MAACCTAAARQRAPLGQTRTTTMRPPCPSAAPPPQQPRPRRQRRMPTRRALLCAPSYPPAAAPGQPRRRASGLSGPGCRSTARATWQSCGPRRRVPGRCPCRRRRRPLFQSLAGCRWARRRPSRTGKQAAEGGGLLGIRRHGWRTRLQTPACLLSLLTCVRCDCRVGAMAAPAPVQQPAARPGRRVVEDENTVTVKVCYRSRGGKLHTH